VLHDLPGVGGNLHDHLQLRTAYKVKNVPTLNTLANSWWGKAKMGLENQSRPLYLWALLDSNQWPSDS
jgi:choline dehydrogenase-like flavoprotein